MVHLSVEMVFKASDGHTGALLEVEAAETERGGMVLEAGVAKYSKSLTSVGVADADA
jgi:hypothetical protein